MQNLHDRQQRKIFDVKTKEILATKQKMKTFKNQLLTKTCFTTIKYISTDDK